MDWEDLNSRLHRLLGYTNDLPDDITLLKKCKLMVDTFMANGSEEK